MLNMAILGSLRLFFLFCFFFFITRRRAYKVNANDDVQRTRNTKKALIEVHSRNSVGLLG